MMDDLYKYKQDHAGDWLTFTMWQLIFWFTIGLMAIGLGGMIKSEYFTLHKSDMLTINETRIYKNE